MGGVVGGIGRFGQGRHLGIAVTAPAPTDHARSEARLAREDARPERDDPA
jgi:hypothetical protein